MFLQSDAEKTGDIATLAEDMIRLGRQSEAVELVYNAMTRMGYPYRAMAEVAVSKLSARRSAERTRPAVSGAESAACPAH